MEVILGFSDIKGPIFNRCKLDEKGLQKWYIQETLLYLHNFSMRSLFGPDFSHQSEDLMKGACGNYLSFLPQRE